MRVGLGGKSIFIEYCGEGCDGMRWSIHWLRVSLGGPSTLSTTVGSGGIEGILERVMGTGSAGKQGGNWEIFPAALTSACTSLVRWRDDVFDCWGHWPGGSGGQDMVNLTNIVMGNGSELSRGSW